MAGDQDDSTENLEPADEAEMTWSDLFGDGSEQVTLELIRLSPAFVGDQPSTGFCGNLQPGANLQSIKEQWGGGKYKLQKKINGAFVKGGFRYLDIVGIPILPKSPTAVSEPTVTAKAPASAPSLAGAAATITVDGVTLPADFQEFKRSMMEIMLFKAALKEPDPINTKLLEMALGQVENRPDELSNILTALGKIKDIATEISPAQASGDGWMGLVSKGLDAFVGFMKTKTAASPPINFAEASASREISTGKEPVLLPERTAELPAIAGDQVSLQQKIQAGLSIIVAGFKLQPPKEIPAVVDILNESLGIAPADRVTLLPFKQNLFDKTELMLADDFACADDPSDARGQFTRYFDEIFNLYCGVTE